MAVHFQILGDVRAVLDGAEVPLGGPRHRRLLAVLLLHAGRTVSSGLLVEALWPGGPPRRATEMLHVRMSELRSALRSAGGPEPISGDGGYRLPVGAGQLDAGEFERLAAAGAEALRGGDPEAARAALAEALARWRGPALGRFADEPFAAVDATRLDALRWQALEDRFAADLLLDRHASIVADLTAAVAGQPLRERFREQLMVALYRSGRPAEALDVFADARTVLAEQLGADPGPALARVHAAVLRQDPELDRPVRPAPIAAPLSSFIGRSRDLAAVRERLRSGRLVTVTGVGGVGKSRLAIEVVAAGIHQPAGETVAIENRGSDGAAVAAGGRDGAWLVELAPVARAELVTAAVARALGVREHPRRDLGDVLADRLRTTGGVLVLDNCEHVLDEAATLAERLLRACPRLRILATSRERLGVPGEQVWRLDGLEPGDAVRLLVERATAVHPGFDDDLRRRDMAAATIASPPTAAATGTNAAPPTAASAATRATDATPAGAAVEHLCRRLDGLPLAIELAAATVPALGVERTAARLDDRFAVLTRGSRTAEPRHRTLRAVVDWSYHLLDGPERRLFERLAVFAGGFTLEAAEAVCAVPGDPPVAVSLATLVDKSLVAVDDDRHRLLETLRAYASDRLAAGDGHDECHDRHAAYTLTMVSTARRALRGPAEPAWLARLERDLDNIRAALDWSIGRGDAGTAVRLAGSLYPLWDRHGHYREGREWLARALALDGAGALRPLVRARALDSLAGLAAIQGDLAAARSAAEEAAALSRGEGDAAGTARALATSGLAALYAGDTPGAVRSLEESLRTGRAAGDRTLTGWALIHLAVAALAAGAWDEAVRRCDEGEPDLRAVADVEGLASFALIRGAAATRRGDRPAADAALAEARAGFARLDHRWGLSFCHQLEAEAAAARGDHRLAVRLAGSSRTLRESVAAAPLPFAESWLDALLADCRAALGEEAYAAAEQVG